MQSKNIIVLCFAMALTIASAVPAANPGSPLGAGAAAPWIPSWIATAPWYPQWSPCTTIGSTCINCNTKMVCTKVGGLKKICTDPTMPYCNAGACSATPSADCAVVSELLRATDV